MIIHPHLVMAAAITFLSLCLAVLVLAALLRNAESTIQFLLSEMRHENRTGNLSAEKE